jgi:hypothetical protein
MMKVTTLQEMETHWSLSDVIIANALLDCQEAADSLAMKG